LGLFGATGLGLFGATSLGLFGAAGLGLFGAAGLLGLLGIVEVMAMSRRSDPSPVSEVPKSEHPSLS
jgi:hypothetical protein